MKDPLALRAKTASSSFQALLPNSKFSRHCLTLWSSNSTSSGVNLYLFCGRFLLLVLILRDSFPSQTHRCKKTVRIVFIASNDCRFRNKSQVSLVQCFPLCCPGNVFRHNLSCYLVRVWTDYTRLIPRISFRRTFRIMETRSFYEEETYL